MRRRLLFTAALALALAPALAQAGEAKKDAKAKEGAPTVETYIALAPLNTSTVGRTGGNTVLTVEIGLDIPDPALHEQAALSLPRLRAGYIDGLQAFGASLTPGAPPNADVLAQRLQQATDKTLGKAGARLLLGSVVVN